MTNESIKSALESILFVWGDPLEAKTAAELFNLPVSDMLHILRELADDYESRRSGLRIREADKAFQLCTNPENDDYITKLCTPVKEKRLSQAALEVLAVIAYKQPVTKAQIDAVRGIKSDRVLETLMKKDLVEEKGRSSSIGRPILYGTTRNFLFTFSCSRSASNRWTICPSSRTSEASSWTTTWKDWNFPAVWRIRTS